MIRLLGLGLLLGAVWLGVSHPQLLGLEQFKEKITTIVNPAAKERALLSNLTEELTLLDRMFSHSDLKNLSSEDQAKIQATLTSAQQAITELQDSSRAKDLVSNLARVVNKVIPGSNQAEPTWLPPGTTCQTPQP